MKRVISLIIVIVMTATSVFAATQSQLNTVKNNLTQAQNQLNSVKKEEKATVAEITNLENNINSTEKRIEDIEEQLESLDVSISVAEENITYLEKQYNEKDEQRKERLLIAYKNRNISSDDIITDDDSIESSYKKRILKEITNYDLGLLAELESDRKEIETNKEQLEINKELSVALKEEAEEKKLALTETKEKRTEYLAEIKESKTELTKMVDSLNAEADKLTKELSKTTSTSTKYAGGTMTWPLPGYYIITSPFGNRLHPVLKVYKLHTGVDIAGSGCNGAKVVAANDGTVIQAGWNTGYGNYIVIDHGGGITTLYGHSQKLLVKKGDVVKKGQTIMLVGTTGYSTGPHLHFEVRENGKYVNPLDKSKGYLKN